MPEVDQSFILDLDRRYTREERRRIARDVIAFIRHRTKVGLDKFGRPFIGYSENYFKEGTVDMTLTNQMLSSMYLKAEGSGFISIGMNNGTANDKVAWHKQGIGKPIRDFFGINMKDYNIILRRYPIRRLRGNG